MTCICLYKSGSRCCRCTAALLACWPIILTWMGPKGALSVPSREIRPSASLAVNHLSQRMLGKGLSSGKWV